MCWVSVGRFASGGRRPLTEALLLLEIEKKRGRSLASRTGGRLRWFLASNLLFTDVNERPYFF